MLVIAHHNVNDPTFWTAAEELSKTIPDNLKLHGVYPSMDGKTGTCLWEAGSAEEVQQFLDKNAGQYAKNFCYEVNAERSVGLPKIQLTATSVS